MGGQRLRRNTGTTLSGLQRDWIHIVHAMQGQVVAHCERVGPVWCSRQGSRPVHLMLPDGATASARAGGQAKEEEEAQEQAPTAGTSVV